MQRRWSWSTPGRRSGWDPQQFFVVVRALLRSGGSSKKGAAPVRACACEQEPSSWQRPASGGFEVCGFTEVLELVEWG